MTTSPPVIAHPSHVDRHYCEHVFNRIGFMGSTRASLAERQYVEAVQGLYREIWPYCTRPQHEAFAADVMDVYRVQYLTWLDRFFCEFDLEAKTFVFTPTMSEADRREHLANWMEKQKPGWEVRDTLVRTLIIHELRVHCITTIASPDDINREFAERAFHGTSFSPEERGESRRQSYANTVNNLYAELYDQAETEEQKTLLAAEMERYRENLLSHMVAYLSSHSRIVSPMIAGPSNFPVRQMQKRNYSTDKRMSELTEFCKKARIAIVNKLANARPAETKLAAECASMRKAIRRCLRTIEEIDEGGAYYTRSAFTSSLFGFAERAANNGEVEQVETALETVREYNASHKKPAITPRHKFWTLPEVARAARVKHDAKLDKEEETIEESEGITIVLNHAIDRVQILLAKKPDRDTTAELRSQGWNWSPTNGAWQRKITANAKYSAKFFFEKNKHILI